MNIEDEDNLNVKDFVLLSNVGRDYYDTKFQFCPNFELFTVRILYGLYRDLFYTRKMRYLPKIYGKCGNKDD